MGTKNNTTSWHVRPKRTGRALYFLLLLIFSLTSVPLRCLGHLSTGFSVERSDKHNPALERSDKHNPAPGAVPIFFRPNFSAAEAWPHCFPHFFLEVDPNHLSQKNKRHFQKPSYNLLQPFSGHIWAYWATKLVQKCAKDIFHAFPTCELIHQNTVRVQQRAYAEKKTKHTFPSTYMYILHMLPVHVRPVDHPSQTLVQPGTILGPVASSKETEVTVRLPFQGKLLALATMHLSLIAKSMADSLRSKVE